MSEKFRRVYVAYDMVHILVIDQYLGIAGLYEPLAQGIPGLPLLDCAYLVAGNHAVTRLDI